MRAPRVVKFGKFRAVYLKTQADSPSEWRCEERTLEMSAGRRRRAQAAGAIVAGARGEQAPPGQMGSALMRRPPGQPPGTPGQGALPPPPASRGGAAGQGAACATPRAPSPLAHPWITTPCAGTRWTCGVTGRQEEPAAPPPAVLTATCPTCAVCTPPPAARPL